MIATPFLRSVSASKPRNLEISLPVRSNFPPLFLSRRTWRFRIVLSSTQPQSDVEDESKTALDWHLVCKHLSQFTSTTMGLALTQEGDVPLGRTREESQELLQQTEAATGLPEPLDFSGISDISNIVNSAISGELCSFQDLCTVRRTIQYSRGILEQLQEVSSNACSERYEPILQILRGTDFCEEIESQIGFCLDCSLSVVLDRASDRLQAVRAERRKNMDEIEALLKSVSETISRSKGIDRSLITRRRSRMCVGVRATHRSLLSDGIILDVSSSGATYFMEPRDAVELNNKEVRLLSEEKREEIAILSMLAMLVAERAAELRGLMGRILRLDLAHARGLYAKWMHGVCPNIDVSDKSCSVNQTDRKNRLLVDIDSIRHPVLLLQSCSSSLSNSEFEGNEDFFAKKHHEIEFPVPLDIKVRKGTKVVVISGPNTGGKTATMKTLGLASLMSKAGMFLPSKKQPKLPWFDHVLADIGDHQSLEHNLSTFSGHISRLCKILEIASPESLVLIDEIGSGTDPSEGVALSTSVLQHLAGQVNLAVVTTHYADLSRLKNSDLRFENAAMEFCSETLKPTYRVLWGTTGDSNALRIARLVGFDKAVLGRAYEWMEKLMPDKEKERKSLIYNSLLQERDKLEAQARKAATVNSEITQIYEEILAEAEDLDQREAALKKIITRQIQNEIEGTKAHIDNIIRDFEKKLTITRSDLHNSLVKEAESAISSILESQRSSGEFISITEAAGSSSYVPKVGDRVRISGLGDKIGTVLEAPSEDGISIVQYGKIRMRVNKSNLKSIPTDKPNSSAGTIPSLQRQARSRSSKAPTAEGETGKREISFSPAVQTSKNTVDLRGMRVEEAAHFLNIALSSCGPFEVLFVVHGMGSGVVKERALSILRDHPRVVKFEQESPMNYGCTIAYIK